MGEVKDLSILAETLFEYTLEFIHAVIAVENPTFHCVVKFFQATREQGFLLREYLSCDDVESADALRYAPVLDKDTERYQTTCHEA